MAAFSHRSELAFVIRTLADNTKLPSLYLTSLHSTPYFQVVPQNVSALLIRLSTWSLSFHITSRARDRGY
jgi:hypothetical protein